MLIQEQQFLYSNHNKRKVINDDSDDSRELIAACLVLCAYTSNTDASMTFQILFIFYCLILLLYKVYK